MSRTHTTRLLVALTTTMERLLRGTCWSALYGLPAKSPMRLCLCPRCFSTPRSRVLHIPSMHLECKSLRCSLLNSRSSCCLNSQELRVHILVISIVPSRSSSVPIEEAVTAKPTEKTHKEGAKKINKEEKKLKAEAKQQTEQEEERLKLHLGDYQAGKHNWYVFSSCALIESLTEHLAHTKTKARHIR